VDDMLAALLLHGTQKEYSCSEIGRIVGLSTARVKQIENRALEKLAIALGKTPDLSIFLFSCYSTPHDHR
jgi:DNA-directed RNA polymerase sigma subunit (sigma70/sigma32)